MEAMVLLSWIGLGWKRDQENHGLANACISLPTRWLLGWMGWLSQLLITFIESELAANLSAELSVELFAAELSPFE